MDRKQQKKQRKRNGNGNGNGRNERRRRCQCQVCHHPTDGDVHEQFILDVCNSNDCREKLRQKLLQACHQELTSAARRQPQTPQQAAAVAQAMQESLRTYIAHAPLQEKRAFETMVHLIELVMLTGALTKRSFKPKVKKILQQELPDRHDQILQRLQQEFAAAA